MVVRVLVLRRETDSFVDVFLGLGCSSSALSKSARNVSSSMLSIMFDALISTTPSTSQDQLTGYLEYGHTGMNDICLAVEKVECLQDAYQGLFQEGLAEFTGPSSHSQRIDGHMHWRVHQASVEAA